MAAVAADTVAPSGTASSADRADSAEAEIEVPAFGRVEVPWWMRTGADSSTHGYIAHVQALKLQRDRQQKHSLADELQACNDVFNSAGLRRRRELGTEQM